MKTAKRFLSMLLVLCLLFGMLPNVAFAANDSPPFADVSQTDWFADAVRYAYEKGMMNGTSADTFAPDKTTTRSMIVTILHRMENTPSASGETFSDVPTGQWYTDAVAWASANKIVNGYGDGKFGPNDPITREQMTAILYRYSQIKNYDVSASGNISDFADAVTVSTYAREAMGWAIGAKLISGVGNQTLAPKGNATRAQIATILMRYCENIAAKQTVSDTTYTVAFDKNDNSASREEKTVKAGETVSKPADPSRTGYTFDDWYTEKTSGSKFDFTQAITADLTLYAHWSTQGSSGGGGGNNHSTTTKPDGSDVTDKQTPSIAITNNNYKTEYSSLTTQEDSIQLTGTTTYADSISGTYVGYDENEKTAVVTGVSSWTAHIPLEVGTNTVTLHALNNSGGSIEKVVYINRISKEIIYKDTVKLADEEDYQTISDGITAVWVDNNATPDDETDDYIVMLVKENSLLLEQINDNLLLENDVYMIPPNDIFLTGFSGVYARHQAVRGTEKYPLTDYPDSEYEELIFNFPGFDDLFKDDISLDFSQGFDPDDPIAFAVLSDETPMGLTVDSGIDQPRSVVRSAGTSTGGTSTGSGTSTGGTSSGSGTSTGGTSDDKDKFPKPGWQLKELKKHIIPGSIGFSVNEKEKTVSLNLAWKDLPLYDHDGSKKTTWDQFKLSGGVGINNLKYDGGLEWRRDKHELLPRQVKGKIEYDLDGSLSLSCGVGLGDVEDEKNDSQDGTGSSQVGNNSSQGGDNNSSGGNDSSQDGDNNSQDNKEKVIMTTASLVESLNGDFKNKAEWGALSVSGVDTFNSKWVIGTIGLNLATFTATAGTSIKGQAEKSVGAPVLLLYLFIDIDGNLSMEGSFSLGYNNHIIKGFNIQKNGFTGAYGSQEENRGEKHYDINKKYTLDIYDTNDPNVSLTLNGSTQAGLDLGPGIGAGVLICGFIPASINGELFFRAKAGVEVEGEIKLYPELSADASFYAEAYMGIGFQADLAAKILAKYQEKDEDTKLEFDMLKYNDSWEQMIWEKNLSTAVFNGKVFESDTTDDKTKNSVIPGATVTLVKNGGEDFWYAVSEKRSWSAVTDDKGFYELKSIPNGKYAMIISKDGYGTKVISDIDFSKEEKDFHVSLDRSSRKIIDRGDCSGSESDHVFWEMDEDGLLTFSGVGDVKRYNSFAETPWSSHQDKIKRVIVNNGVTSLGTHALHGCNNLTSVKLSESVQFIWEGTFEDCKNLTSVVMPKSVNIIMNNAFTGSTSLADVYYAGSEQEWKYINIDPNNEPLLNATIHYNYTGDDLIPTPPEDNIIASGYCGEATDPSVLWGLNENVTWTLSKNGVLTFSGVGNMSWFNPPGYSEGLYVPWVADIGKVKSVIIEDGVTNIGNHVFCKCTLTNITIPNSVTSIGYGAFLNCRHLTSVTIPSSVTSIEDHAFEGCSNLTSVTISEGVTSIGNYAFSGCSNLTNIIIPDSVTHIGHHAFEGCSNLSSVTIADGVTFIDGYVFKDCTNLISVTIPDSVTAIGYGVFEGCGNLTCVTISKNMTEIPNGTFQDCSNLTDIVIPDNIISIEMWAFSECKGLTSIIIPDSVANISSAFMGCTGLVSVIIPNGVNDISWAFSGCEGLTSVVIPNSVTEITGAFSDCTGLTGVIIKNGVTDIGWQAFDNCTSLTNVVIPNSVSRVTREAFLDCVNLTDVYYAGSEADWQAVSIEYGNESLTNAKIHYNSTEPKSRSTDSGLVEPETASPAEEPTSQNTATPAKESDSMPEETSDTMPEELPPEEEKEGDPVLEESQPEEDDSEALQAA